MKKIMCGFVFGIIVCLGIQVFAADILQVKKATFDVFVKGKKFESEKSIVVIDGSTYLPLKDIGTALDVPVTWNSGKRRVEVAMRSFDGALSNKQITPKSNVLTIIKDVGKGGVKLAGSKYYVRLDVFSNYTKREGDKIYLELPNKERMLVLDRSRKPSSTEYSVERDGVEIYIDLEACGIKHTIEDVYTATEDSILWIE
jgi:hypothetical protein